MERKARPEFHICDLPPSPVPGGEENTKAWRRGQPIERICRGWARSDLRDQIGEIPAITRKRPGPWPLEFRDDRSSPAGQHPCKASELCLSREFQFQA